MKIVFCVRSEDLSLGEMPIETGDNPMQIVLDPAIFTKEALAFDEVERMAASVAQGQLLDFSEEERRLEETLEAQFEVIRRYVRIELRKLAREKLGVAA